MGRFDGGGRYDKKRDDFGDAQWAKKAQAWAAKTAEIKQSRWKDILTDTEAFISPDNEDDDYAGNGDNEGVDPRTLVVLD